MATEENQGFEDALVEELRDLLDAEKQILKALPKMVKAAENEELQSAFEGHREETEEHVQRLGQALEKLGKGTRAKPCEGMKGIIKEGDEQISEKEPGPVLDAILIAGAQKVEHYEIASYGTVIAWAKQLGQSRIASVLSKTLEEEKAADQKLTGIAEALNAEAQAGA